MDAFEQELQKFPLSGRFLANRLRHAMSQEQRRRLESMITQTTDHKTGDRIIARGQTCDHSTLLVEGFMLRTLEMSGKRFIVSLHVPGDFVDLHCFALKRLDHNIDCIGSVRTAAISHDRISRVMADDPELARFFWFSTLLDAALHREWILKLEQLTAPRRIAHIFAEMWHRLQMVGLGHEDGFKTPLTQTHIAEMCGATSIHANRAISELRRLELADFRRGEVRIPDREKLETYADFSPDYLYGDGALALQKSDF